MHMLGKRRYPKTLIRFRAAAEAAGEVCAYPIVMLISSKCLVYYVMLSSTRATNVVVACFNLVRDRLAISHPREAGEPSP
jgi:hypothetical protein